MTPTVALFAEPKVSLEDTAVASVADASAPKNVIKIIIIKSALIEDDRSITFLLVFENKGLPILLRVCLLFYLVRSFYDMSECEGIM